MRASLKLGVVSIVAVLGLSGGDLAVGAMGAAASPAGHAGAQSHASNQAGANNPHAVSGAHSSGSNRPAAKHIETGAWSIVQQPNAYTDKLAGAACVTGTTTCWVTGGKFGVTGRVFKSTDGGATWTAQSASLPATQGGLSAISCPTVSVCFAGGGVMDPVNGARRAGIVATTDGGATWSSRNLPSLSSPAVLRGISCSDSTHCVAVGYGGTILATTDGSTWTTQTSGTSDDLYGVSCTNSTHCFAVGESGTILATTDGSTWSPQTSGTSNRLYGVSCADGTHCIAVGANGTILATTDGSTWSPQTSGTSDYLYGLSCADSTHCIAVGGSGTIVASTDGATWSPQTSGISSNLSGVACASTSLCVAGAQASDSSTFRPATALFTTNGGAGWNAVVPFPALRKVKGMACPQSDPVLCYAAQVSGPNVGGSDSVISRTTDGVHWTPVYTGAPGSGAANAISCADAMHCTFVGYSKANDTGVIVATTNGWASAVPQTSGTTEKLRGVSCPSDSTCFAVGDSGTILATTDGGATWNSQTAPGGFNGINAVSCADSMHCVAAADQGLAVTTDGGATWTAPMLPGTLTEFFLGVNCPDTSHCVAVGDSGQIATTTDGGATWADHSVSVPANEDWDLWSVSCWSTTACAASGGTGFYHPGHPGLVLATSDGGATWASTFMPAPQHGVPAIACVSGGACWAGGALGGIVTNFLPTAKGYWMVGRDGGAFAFGAAGYWGSLPGLGIHVTNVVGIVPTADGGGYWMNGSDGGVFAFGDAGYLGSIPGLGIHVTNVVGFAPTPDGHGYWMVGSDGGIFAFGSAKFYGSMGGIPLNKPMVAIVATPSGKGYWTVASDGGIFAFGDAGFFGSMGGKPLNQPMKGIAATSDGHGYWTDAADGGIFSFGDAQFYGSVPQFGIHIANVVGMAASPSGLGYWMDGNDGGVFSFGDAGFFGSLPGLGIHVTNIVGMAPARG